MPQLMPILGFLGGVAFVGLPVGAAFLALPPPPAPVDVGPTEPLTRGAEVYVTIAPEVELTLDRSGLTLRMSVSALVAPGEGSTRLMAHLDTSEQAVRAALQEALNAAIGPGPFDRLALIEEVREVIRLALDSLPEIPRDSVREVLLTSFDVQ